MTSLRTLLLGVGASLALSMSAQTPHGFMAVKEGHWTDGAKILYHGRTYRPAGAKNLCATCWEARDHFERARRVRIRSFLIANLGVFEVALGATQFEDVRALGVFHGVVGGALMSWAAEREAKVRREVRAGVEAFNRCQFLPSADGTP